VNRLAAIALCTAMLLPCVLPAPARAGDEPFTGPSNYGLTGLLETPTARVMKENRFRLGATQVQPYRFYYGTVGLFERFEINGRVTEILGVPAFQNIPGSSYGNYKDKAVDFKLQVVKEGKYLPALAIAISDPTGTRLYASQSIVASKQVFPFDFSLGMGNGRFGKNPLPPQGEGVKMEMFTNPSAWWNDSQLFGGIQFSPVDWLSLMAEYSPIRYDLQTGDPAQAKYFPKPVPSKINAGLRLKPFRWAEVDLSWQRGQEFGVSASISSDIGKPFLPIYDPPYREPDNLRRDPLAERIAAALHASGFSDIGVDADGFTLRVDAENDRYFFTPRAVEVLVDAVAPLLPPGYEYIRIRIKENGIPMTEFITTGPALEELREGRIPPARFFAISTFRSKGIGSPIPQTADRRWYDWGVAPSFEAFLNDPAKYISYRLGVKAWLEGFTWRGGTAVASVEAYPLNTVTTANRPLSIPVRSDIALYKEQDVSLGQLLFDQVVRTDQQLYARAAGGLLEIMYAGLDGEVAMPLLRGRFVVGSGGALVKKRDPDNPFALASNTWYHTLFLNARLNIPEVNVAFGVQAGRFLAGDQGVRFTFSKYINGVKLSAWYSATDTSIFSDPYNKGYHDKGISVEIPIRLFLGHDSRTTYTFSLSPWTRDVGQDIFHYRSLMELISRYSEISIDKDADSLYKSVKISP